jgi:itaconyl-CoA hydratase
MNGKISRRTSPDNYFEDFTVGQVIEHARGKTISEVENVLITNMVMNTAQAHFNEDRMAKGKLNMPNLFNRVVYGGVNFSLVMGLAGQDTGEQVLEECGLDKIRLKHPVLHGDTLYAFTEVLEKRDADRPDAGIIRFRHYGINQDDKLIFEGERTALIKRRSAWIDR